MVNQVGFIYMPAISSDPLFLAKAANHDVLCDIGPVGQSVKGLKGFLKGVGPR